MATSSRLSRSAPFIGAIAAALMGYFAYTLGNTYVPRMSSHDGYFLVPVEDRVEVPVQLRPRHTVLVIIDGLRRDRAESLTSIARVRDAGHCRVMYTGPLTVSHPIFAVMSSGVEVHRTGARNNRTMTPLAVESIWQVAHEAGLRVSGTGSTPWWSGFFPDGFDHSDGQIPYDVDYLARTELTDVNLIHVPDVDEEGHAHGAASSHYQAAMDQVDVELNRFLDRLDLSRDLIVVTADHGHTMAGGHGGIQPEIANTLTCYAGPTIAASSPAPASGGPDGSDGDGEAREFGRMDVTTLGPSLAVLLGVRFPRHMRAEPGDGAGPASGSDTRPGDDLDTIWQIVSTERLGADYVADRKRAIERFRAENRARLKEWLGSDDDSASWSALYQRERRPQIIGLTIALGLILGLVVLSLRLRRLGLKRSLAILAWMTGTVAVTFAIYTIARGSFDFTSINKREPFILASQTICLSVAVVSALVHAFIWRRAVCYIADQLTLIAVFVAIGAAHPLIYGNPLGFPLPGQVELFIPFIAAAFGLANGIWTTLVCLALAARAGLQALRRSSGE